MAQVAQDPGLRDRIDDYISYLTRKWEAMPELAGEWDEWDELSRLTFACDWGVPADRLHQLERWAEQGLLTAPQRARFDQLLRLVAQHGSVLERLLVE